MWALKLPTAPFNLPVNLSYLIQLENHKTYNYID
jgi:hypothetical protein